MLGIVQNLHASWNVFHSSAACARIQLRFLSIFIPASETPISNAITEDTVSGST